jgi:hypothetical protein
MSERLPKNKKTGEDTPKTPENGMTPAELRARLRELVMRVEKEHLGNEVPATPDVPPIELPVSSIEPHASVGSASHEEIITNKFGILVSVDHPHIYADMDAPEKMFVYGGSLEEQVRMVAEHLSKDPYGVIYSADANGHRIAWSIHYPDMEIRQSPPVPADGLNALFSPLMKPPEPDEFGKIIE